ncbi:MAG: GNAT family N-acetyltransferase [Ruminococcaceae bacterium]|nr:GNAT family N-acetyltransferase [Oscillospiraceae bacterium]
MHDLQESLSVVCCPATPALLEQIWARTIARHPDDPRWEFWREEALLNNRTGRSQTFLVIADGIPVGEGTLLFSPECGAIRGRTALADGKTVTNINALRIEKAYEGQGHISRLVRLMEEAARAQGYRRISIGVEEQELRNRAIYHHWGYRDLLFRELEDGEPVLYYEKKL